MVQPTPRPDWPAVLIVDRPGDVIHLASTFLSGTELYSCGLDGKHHGILFTERELSICYRPSVCRRLSSVNVRAPYSGGSNFRQYFDGIKYLGHPLTSTENFTEIVAGEPLRR